MRQVLIISAFLLLNPLLAFSLGDGGIDQNQARGIRVNTSDFGTIPSTENNVQKALDWLDDNMGVGSGDMDKATYDADDDGIIDPGHFVELDPALTTHESTYNHALIATALQAEADALDTVLERGNESDQPIVLTNQIANTVCFGLMIYVSDSDKSFKAGLVGSDEERADVGWNEPSAPGSYESFYSLDHATYPSWYDLVYGDGTANSSQYRIFHRTDGGFNQIVNIDDNNGFNLFNGDDVGDNADGLSLFVHRKASEGDKYARLFIDQYQGFNLFTDCGFLWLQAGTIDAVGDVVATKDHFYVGHEWISAGDLPLQRWYGYISGESAGYLQLQLVNSTSDYFTFTSSGASVDGLYFNLPTAFSSNLTLQNAGFIGNATDNAISFGDNSEDLAFSFGSNTCTLGSSTGVTALTISPAVTMSAGTTFNAGSTHADDQSCKFGGGTDMAIAHDTNGTGDDINRIYLEKGGTSNSRALLITDSNPNNMTECDDFFYPTLVFMGSAGADSGDYAGVYIGGRTTADVTAQWYFDFFAKTGNTDGGTNATKTELAPIFRFGDAGTATTGHSLASGDVLFEDDIEVDGTAYFDGDLSDGTMSLTVSEMAKQSYINGMIVQYEGATNIYITAGECIANGKYYRQDSKEEVATGATSGTDFYYVYIDDSESAEPDVTWVISNTEPAYTSTTPKIGWYNGDDRCVGCFYTSGANTVSVFYADNAGENEVTCFITNVTLAYDTNPNGSWNDTTTDADLYTPVNTNAVNVYIAGADSSSSFTALVRSNVYLFSMGGYSISYSYHSWRNLWLIVPPSDRTLELYGTDDDDNALSCSLQGYSYLR